MSVYVTIAICTNLLCKMQWYRKYFENSRCTRWYKIQINIVLSSHPTHPSHPSYARHPSYPSHASHSIHVHTVRTGSLLTVIVFSPFRYVSSIIFFYLWRPALELNGLPYVNKVLLYFTLLFRRKSRTYEKNNDSIYDKVWESQSAWDKSITDKVMVSLYSVCREGEHSNSQFWMFTGYVFQEQWVRHCTTWRISNNNSNHQVMLVRCSNH